MSISVVIPVYNEEQTIQNTLDHLNSVERGLVDEIIVVDGGSTDETARFAAEKNATVIVSPRKGRAVQMNYGASVAQGEVLYFLHADSLPPKYFDQHIVNAVSEGYQAGCFRLKFDWNHPLLKFYGWCTRFDCNAFRFGDQSLFVRKKIFEAVDGFREDHIVMEDNEIIRRLQNKTDFRILTNHVITSARKYRENGVVKLQLVFVLIYTLYFLNVSQKKLRKLYKKLIG